MFCGGKQRARSFRAQPLHSARSPVVTGTGPSKQLRLRRLNSFSTFRKRGPHIYGVSGASYKIQLTGAEAAPPSAAADQPESSGPQIEQIMPRVYNKATLVLALALGILAVGFAMLYRAEPGAPSPKESHERGGN